MVFPRSLARIHSRRIYTCIQKPMSIYKLKKEVRKIHKQYRAKKILDIYEKKGRIIEHSVHKKLKAKRECNSCKKKFNHALEIDHIIPLCQNGTSDESNLQVLCHTCHKEKTLHELKNEPTLSLWQICRK